MARKKQKVSLWVQENFTADSRPSVNTVKGWIRDRMIDGVMIGGLYYVYEDQSAPCAPETAQQASKLTKHFFDRAP